MIEQLPHRNDPLVSPRVAQATIFVMWLVYALVNTVRAAVYDKGDQFDMLVRRTAVVLLGMAMTYVIYLIMRRMRDKSFRARAVTAFSLCVPLALGYASVNFTAFYVMAPSLDTLKELAEMAAKGLSPAAIILDYAINWYFMFGAWAALYLALVYSAETRIAEQQAADYRAAAQAAELRALRYQVNPHFLFNTLNSLSTLVMVGRQAEAEAMILNLSTFFRSSLASDPSADVSLAEELRLQQLYLDIEKVRFPERLLVRLDVPDALGAVPVPALILQPLVENAIKYGVSRARRPVTITLRARTRPGELILSVEDDGDGNGEGSAPDSGRLNGTGTGLKNVRDRLEARFGKEARTLWGPVKPRGFAAVIALPLNAAVASTGDEGARDAA